MIIVRKPFDFIVGQKVTIKSEQEMLADGWDTPETLKYAGQVLTIKDSNTWCRFDEIDEQICRVCIVEYEETMFDDKTCAYCGCTFDETLAFSEHCDTSRVCPNCESTNNFYAAKEAREEGN